MNLIIKNRSRARRHDFKIILNFIFSDFHNLIYKEKFSFLNDLHHSKLEIDLLCLYTVVRIVSNEILKFYLVCSLFWNTYCWRERVIFSNSAYTCSFFFSNFQNSSLLATKLSDLSVNYPNNNIKAKEVDF